MKINKLNDEFFFEFASYILGVDVKFYKHDSKIKRDENCIKFKFYLGGEMEDGRKFLFKDDKCVFKSSEAIYAESQDLSYQWVQFLLANAVELTEQDRLEIVDSYNNNIEKEIRDYTSKKREALIV